MIEGLVVTRMVEHPIPACPQRRGSSSVKIDRLMKSQGHAKVTELEYSHSFRLAGEELNAFARLCQRYVLGQLERGFATLDFYQSLFP
jgi:hypothetical protein